MGSERMPGKVLKNLSGKPSLIHIFDILKEAKKINDFIVLTTILNEDDVIENICNLNGVRCIRGSVHDVLDRFRIAAEALKPDRIIRVTGDDPLMDPGIIDKVIEEHDGGDYDYTSNMIERTYPRGMDTEVIEFEALKKSWQSTSDIDDHEHVTLYIRRHPDLFKIHNVRKEGEPLDNIRLCLDTEEDSKLISEIYKHLYDGNPIKLEEIISFLNNNPELKAINSDIKQKPVKGMVF